MLQANAVLFGDRYTLVRIIQQAGEYQVWEARDAYGGPILLKAWHFEGARPVDEERALWNAELRHLFRLASLPEAEDHLVVLRDAGIDTNHSCFVMAMAAPGLYTLESLFSKRASCEWLRNLATAPVRAELWRGIKRLALGLVQLHEQQMLHRAISAASVVVDRDRGPSTLRLGGFEWTVRLGDNPPPDVAPLPRSEGTYSFETDWFLLGNLIAQLIAATNGLSNLDAILNKVRQQPFLTGDESDLIERLLADDRNSRLSRGYEVIRRIDDIVTVLDQLKKRRPEDYLALLVLLGPQRQLTLAVIQEDDAITALEVERQRQFIEDDLRQPRIVRRRRGGARDGYILVGNRLSYYVTEFLRDDAAPGPWDLAYCSGSTEVRSSGAEDEQTTLERPPIKVFTLRALSTDETVVRKAAVPWKPYLPRVTAETTEMDDLQRLHDFFRVTNQIELLMRDSEIFAYHVVESRAVDGAEEVVLREEPRVREVPSFARTAENLPDFLVREREENRDGDLVYLGGEDALDVGREVPRTEFWNVTEVNPDSGLVRLRRPRQLAGVAPQAHGFLRAFGLFGQMSLIKRRKRAIEQLGNHAYLLRALQTPDFAFLDTGERTLPRPLDPERIDKAKRSAMHSLWRTRPIFALQGPPGTGKTTLVAHLLAQIFADDSVAQVLVTAQAHAAVDVLRERVAREIGDAPNPPLAIRLKRTKGDETPDPDYVEQVANRILVRAVNELGNAAHRTSLQARWLEVAQEAIRALARRDALASDTEGHARDLCRLVERAAGITYCTTTAGNLAELADSTQTFDWSIIEEAGKAHGFDLALPLQTGHRWLLIGDQKQLAPYRIEAFRSALLRLDSAFEAIEALPQRAGGQADIDLVLRWDKYDSSEKASRRDRWLYWLKFFEALHDTCSRVRVPGAGEQLDETVGPVLAQMLWQQHRMHPTIADLVSAAYYEGKIESMTVGVDKQPVGRVIHPFEEPTALVRRALVWLDVPWVGDGGRGEVGPEVGGARFTSPDEIDAVESFLAALAARPGERISLALLSLYRRQVRELNLRLANFPLPPWVQSSGGAGPDNKRGLAATVDSFQGNQAGVVVVSLVRNNRREPGKGLGFLREAQRMNVLFSRAERLLVLVGSWEFFQRQLAGIPADDKQPLGHWRIAIDYIDSCFRSGSAVRIAASALPPTV